jgi:GntR family transcriptional regulator
MSQPAYRDIADAIRQDIASAHLVEGDRLPTVRELANRFQVPVGTVARALDLLRAEGIVVSRHGRGLYVRAFSRIARISPNRLSRQHWASGSAIQDHDTGVRLRVVHVEVTEVPATELVAEALGVPVGAAVLSRARKFAVDDRVVQAATSHIPLDIVAAVPAVAYTGPGPGGIYARMAEAGVGPERFSERIICRMPTPAESADLDLPTGTPVVSIVRQAFSAAERCVEVNSMLLDASAYLLEYRFGAE